jgi:hypothetical protein
MNSQDKLAGEMEDPVLAEALRHFKTSVDTWSEAAYSRPRTAVTTKRHSWRLAAGWAFGCVMAFGCLAGGLYERFHSQELARIAVMKAAQQKAAHERLARVEKFDAREKELEKHAAVESSDAATSPVDTNDDLLATLDTDVSREVPSAMEPLAQLMDESGAKDNGTK